jgi:hypothetical protein
MFIVYCRSIGSKIVPLKDHIEEKIKPEINYKNKLILSISMSMNEMVAPRFM